MTANFLPVGGGRRAGVKTNFVSADSLLAAFRAPEQAFVTADNAVPGAPTAWFITGLNPPAASVAHSYARVANQDEVVYSYANVSGGAVNSGIQPERIQQIRGSVRTGRWLGEAGALWVLGRTTIPSPGPVPDGGVLEFSTGIMIGDTNIDPRISAEAFGMSLRAAFPSPMLGFSHFRTATPTGEVFMTLYNLDAAPQDPGALTFDWVAQAPRVNTDDIFAPNRGIAYMRSFRCTTPAMALAAREGDEFTLSHAGSGAPFEAEDGDVIVASPVAPLVDAVGDAKLCLSHCEVDYSGGTAGRLPTRLVLSNLDGGVTNVPTIEWDVLLCRNQGLGRNV